MKSKIMILVLLLSVLSACDSTPTESSPAESPPPEVAPTHTIEPTDPPTTGLACLSGTWELVNVENYMNSVVPPDLAGSLTFVESSGTASAIYAADGTYTYRLDEFRVLYSMDGGTGPLTMEVYMDGEGAGIYDPIDDRTLSFTQLDDSGVAITFTLAGEIFDLGMDDAATAFGSPDTIFEFDCDGNMLLTYPPIEGALPVEYARVP